MGILQKRFKKANEFFNSIIEKPLLTSTIVLVIVTILVLGLVCLTTFPISSPSFRRSWPKRTG